MENIFEEQPSMTMDDIYIYKEWDDIIASERQAEKEDKQLKQRYKSELKNLINTRVVWEWLGEHDTWKPLGIFAVRIVNKHNSYYNRAMPHAQIQSEEYKHLNMHWQEENKREVGTNHYFVEQWCYGEDSYSGFIAFPLKDHRYFLISYSC